MQHLEMFSFLYVQFQCGLVVSSKLHLAFDVLPVRFTFPRMNKIILRFVPAQVDKRRRRGVDDLGFHITLPATRRGWRARWLVGLHTQQ